MDRGEDGVWYPTVRDVLMIHNAIIDEDSDATPGVQDEQRIQFAIDYIRKGHFGEVPETIHDKAFHLMRLMASNHWFADGNKRTALNTTELFYKWNGHELDYGDDIRSMLKLFSVREKLIDQVEGPKYLQDNTTTVPTLLDDLELDFVTALSDTDVIETLSTPIVDSESLREQLGLTTQYGTTINIGERQEDKDNGG